MTLAGRFGDPKTERDILSAKRFNFFALIVLIGTMGAAFLLYMQLINKQAELETKTQQLADSTANLMRIRSELEAAQLKLTQREVEMEQSLQSLSASVENREFDSAVVKATEINLQLERKEDNEITVVHLYSWQPQKGVLSKIDSYLREPDYLLVQDQILDALPEWMGTTSAVYYYSPKVADKAETLAKQLSAIAGQPFAAKLGSTDQAPQRHRYEWMHIYYLGARLPMQK